MRSCSAPAPCSGRGASTASTTGGEGSAPSAPMQQATVNLLADMLVQPPTLQTGLPGDGLDGCDRTDLGPEHADPHRHRRQPGHRRRHGRGHRRWARRRRRGLGRRRGDMAPGNRARDLELHVDTGRQRPGHRPQPRGRRQRQPRGSRHEAASRAGSRPPGGPTPPPGGTPNDLTAPRVPVRPRRVRASRRRWVALRVRCPQAERLCRVDLRLRRGQTTLARKKFTVAGGKTRRVSLRLTRSAQRRLVRSRSLPVVAVAVARDAAGNRATTRTRIRLLAPRRG